MLQLSLQPRIAVGYSGGADSTALLLLCAQQYPGQVQALHIHHGLQAAADDFAAHCQAFCAQLKVPLQVLHVHAHAAAGQSPEDAARRARYNALSAWVIENNRPTTPVNSAYEAIKTIAIAQHADDQVETLLLALGRGAGLPGLASMPERWSPAVPAPGLVEPSAEGLDKASTQASTQSHRFEYVRPLLSLSAAQIRTWLAAQGLQARQPGQGVRGQGWVEDPSNASEQFTRNRIRAKLLPAFAEVFPQFRETFARSARHAAQAQALLAQLAIEDIASGLADTASAGSPAPALRIAALQKLSPARQANALRHWLKAGYATAPSTAQLAELQSQIAACTTRGHRIHIKVANGFVLRQGALLVFHAV